MDSFCIRHLEKDALFAAFTVIVIFIIVRDNLLSENQEGQAELRL